MSAFASETAQERIADKTALVTGAGRRVGRAIATHLARAGANIIVHFGSSEAEAADVCRELDQLGVQAWPLQADLADEAQCEGLIPRALGLSGSLDILVNSASIFPAGRMNDASIGDLTANLRVNTWAPFIIGKSFAGAVHEGSIVNILDSNIVSYTPGHMPYLLSKQVLAILTRQMALEWAPRIAVNAVAPGLILAPDGTPPEAMRRLLEGVPMRRQGSPDDVAEAVVYLASSRFITGQTIFVDGGRHLRGTEGLA